MILNAQQMPIRIDIGALAMAFKDGGIAFITDLNNDAASFKTADDRAQHFLRWGTAVASLAPFLGMGQVHPTARS